MIQRRMIRRGASLLAGLALSALGAQPGKAGDFDVLWRATDAELGKIDWSGLIINPDVGYDTLKLKGTGRSLLGDPKGWRAGGEIGYDRQLGAIVFGGAGEWFYSWLKSTGASPDPFAANLKSFGTLRTRLGVAEGRFMGYATAGWAFGQLEVRNAASHLTERHVLGGWAAGAGIEYVWNRSATLRAEYVHIGLGKADFSLLPAPTRRVAADMDMIKLGIVTRF